MGLRESLVLTDEDRYQVQELATYLDAVVELTRQDAPFLLPIIGSVTEVLFKLAVRVQRLEARDGDSAP